MVTCSVISFSQTQSKKELERKREKLQKEIEETSQLLKKVSKNKNVSLAQVETLKKKIRLREDLIRTVNSEINSLGGQIVSTSKEIQSLENQLQNLKEEYADMILFAYKNKNQYQQLMFVFASNDFNQAYKRMKYMQQYSEARKQQAEMIEQTAIQLGAKKQELEAKKNEKQNLKTTEEKQKQNLVSEKKEQDQIVTNLQKSEERLKKQLAEKQKSKERLDAAIEKLIRKEIAEARKKAAAAGNKNVTAANVFTLTPEAQKLSNSFSGNRGHLPWPVEQGVVTETFGTHPHPDLKGVTIKNDGVAIQTAPGSSARAVFEGEVTGTLSIPGGNNAVIIRHGDFLTVYSNLDNVLVRKGDKITTKQKIGSIHIDSEDKKAELQFQIWKGTNKLDPESWLARK